MTTSQPEIVTFGSAHSPAVGGRLEDQVDADLQPVGLTLASTRTS